MTPYELFRTSCSHNSSKYSESRGPYPAVSSYFGGAQSHAFLHKCKSMTFCSWCFFMTPYELFRTSCSHNSSKYSESRGPYPAVSSYFGGAQSHAFLRKCKSMTFCSWCHKKTPVLLRNEKDESKLPCYHLCSQPAHAVCLGRYPIDTPTVITSVSPSQPTHRFGVKLGDVFESSFRVGLSPSGASLYVSSESTCSRHCCFLLSHGISIQKGSADCQGFRENIYCLYHIIRSQCICQIAFQDLPAAQVICQCDKAKKRHDKKQDGNDGSHC